MFAGTVYSCLSYE